jgi:membrane-associated phospholipid phosphatase
MVPGRRVAVAVRPRARLQAPRQPARLAPVDLLLLAYLTVVTMVAADRAPAQPGCWWVVAANVLAAMLVGLLARAPARPALRTLRELYPLLLLPVLYGELDLLNRAGPMAHDALVQRWELALFGSQVSREWWRAAPSVFWSTLLHGAYFSYYFIVSVPAFWFVSRGNHAAARRFVLAVMATFVACYLVFVFFPVAGPYYVFPRPADWFLDNPAARLVYRTLAGGSSYGAAFPSSHVAATVAAAIATWQGSRRLGIVLLIPTILLTVGVVYCQMHYAVDALAGLLLGAGVATAVAMLERRKEGK